MEFRHIGLTAIAMILAGTALVAQVNTGQLNGKILDEHNKPIPGVRVVLTSPNMQLQRTVMSDAAGEWRAPFLPPGSYSLSLSKTDYLSATVKGIRVGAGADIHQDARMKRVEVASTVVEVVASAATVDKTDTKTSVNFSSEQLMQLTGGRSFGSVVDLTPGVSNGGNNSPIIRGGQTTSTILSLNGQDIKDPVQNTVDAYYLIEDNVEDVQVVLSPLNARNGRTMGGSINIVTKSGTNDFQGSIRAKPGRSTTWGARSKTMHDPSETNDGWSNSYDVTLSGPILKDRIWFSYGTTIIPSSTSTNWTKPRDPAYRRAIHAGDASKFANADRIDQLTATDPSTSMGLFGPLKAGGFYVPTFDSSKPFTSSDTTKFHEAKLSFAISENHKIQFFGSHQDWTQGSVGGDDKLFLDQTGPQHYMAQMWGTTYNAILGSQTFLEARVSRQKQWNQFNHGNTKLDPTHTAIDLRLDAFDAQTWSYIGNPIGTGGGPLDERNSTNGGLNLKLYRQALGLEHDIDVGVDFFRAEKSTTDRKGDLNETVRVGGIYTNGTDWLFPTLIYTGKNSYGQSGSGNSGLAPMIWKYYGQDGMARNDNLGTYINDQITINKNWNLMLGLRVDRATVKDTDGSELISATSLSPRFVLTYDLNGDSSRIFKFNYSRMTSDFPLAFTGQWLKNAAQKGIQLPWKGIAGQPLPGTASDVVGGTNMYGLRFVTLAQLLDASNYGGTAMSFWDNSKSYVRDPDLKPMVNDEYAFEFRRNWDSGSYLRTAYVYRVQSKIWASSQEYDPSYWAVLSDPSGSGLHSMYAQQTHVFNSDALWRDYHGLEVEANIRVNPIFSWGFGYTYSRLRGNTDAGDGTNSFGDYGVPGYYQNRNYLKQVLHASDAGISPIGNLMNDVPHTASLRGTAVVPIGKGWISYSAILTYSSGTNWNATYASPINEGAEAGKSIQDIYNTVTAQGGPYAVSPLLTWSKFYADRGSYHMNDYTNVNLNIAFELPISGRLKAMGQMSIFNLFNHIAQLSYMRDFDVNTAGQTALFLKTDRFGTTGQTSATGYDNYWNNPRSVSMSFGLKF